MWSLADLHDRPPPGGMGGPVLNPIPTSAVRGLCEAYDESLETFEKILLVERIVFPLKAEARAQQMKEEAQDEK